ncbi:hypothetical protein DVS77_26395 [Mycolicibacterium moriokaense]|nr:hypothetical protein DVS77_26395 [Mycolicibacterium moriokaense]
MARDTRGESPADTTTLVRVSLQPGHWRQGRRLLAAEAVCAAGLGILGLTTASVPLGLMPTAALGWLLVGVGMAAAIACAHRKVALGFTGVIAASALALTIICPVAAAHGAPGPLGFTVEATLLYAALFAYNFGVAVWLVPDHIEGPAWLPRRIARRRSKST